MEEHESLDRAAERQLNDIVIQNPLPRERGNREHIEQVADHIERHLGPIHQVFHEIASDIVHIDIHHVKPTPQRDFNILITTGMSEKAMVTPTEAWECRFAELMLFLPPSWPLTMEVMKREELYWPVRWMKMLARFPHEHETWLGWGHTVPNGDPPEPFASDTKLCGFLIMGPPIEYEPFFAMKVNPGKTVYFYEMMPLYREEMKFKLRHGVDALLDRFAAGRIGHVLDVRRRNVCRGKKR
ncbi:MAG: suppressor of fused domain protein [Candidatus Eremiobacteraeota bacterium]|nr:suppressor of fused domain protein [Candidatus Eremiobacteraeota bacterium]